ncbi:MAG: hypothetical protein ACRDZW_01875, partial [Acidimicrobiales bacterium]
MTDFCVDPTSSPVRRRLGPAPWFVLEELVLVGDGEGAETNVRSLAAGLSLNKDTVARALGRLRAAGLVVVEPRLRSAGDSTPAATASPRSRASRCSTKGPTAHGHGCHVVLRHPYRRGTAPNSASSATSFRPSAGTPSRWTNRPHGAMTHLHQGCAAVLHRPAC